MVFPLAILVQKFLIPMMLLKKIIYRLIWVWELLIHQYLIRDSKITFGLDINKLMVPTPPAVGDSAGLVEYRSKSVVSSWFKSFGDAPGGFSEELRELPHALGAEYWYQNQFAFRAGYFYENPNKGNRQYFTLGAGLKYKIFGLNFSYLIPSG